MLNPKTGKILYFALKNRDDERDFNDPMIPGICTVCGALVAGWNVQIFHEDGNISPAHLHHEWHEARGELK